MSAELPLASLAVAYVVRLYPKVSHTFIEREVAALRSLGATVDTYSLRRSPEDEVQSERDRAEQRRTTALLPLPLGALAAAHARLLTTRPKAYATTLFDALRWGPPGVRAQLRQLAYFAQAVLLHDAAAARRPRHLHAHLANVATDVTWLAATIGNRSASASWRSRPAGGPARWTWSFTMHGPTELHEHTRFNLARKVAAADAVVCISEYCRSQLMAITDPAQWDKLLVVHCGVNLDDAPAPRSDGSRPVFNCRNGEGELSPACSETDEPADEAEQLARKRRSVTPHIVSIGRLVPEKAHMVFLDALAELAARGYDVQATIIGDGPDRARLLARRNALALADRVAMPGAFGQDKLAELWPETDIFCLPSFDEGVPVVLMEAMAHRLPVVTTRIAGIPELVEHGVSGVLVPPGRTDLLVDALGGLLADPDRRARLGAAGRAAVERGFDARSEAVRLGAHLSTLAAAPAG